MLDKSAFTTSDEIEKLAIVNRTEKKLTLGKLYRLTVT